MGGRTIPMTPREMIQLLQASGFVCVSSNGSLRTFRNEQTEKTVIVPFHAEDLKKAARILKDNGTPLLITQPNYNMFDRWVEKDGLLTAAEESGCGVICFSPLAQGMLTDKYLNGIPENSRASRNHFLKSSSITEEKLEVIRKLNDIAKERGQSLAQMALSWVLRDDKVTTVLIGASCKEQIENNVRIVEHLDFTSEDLERIENVIKVKA